MKANLSPDPTWARLGLYHAPRQDMAGRDVGIVIIDNIRPHPALDPLGDRLRHVLIHEDMTVTCGPPVHANENHFGISWQHGIKSVLCMAHFPFERDGRTYHSLAPAANYIVLSYGWYNPERLKRGIEWIIENRTEWNIRIVLTMGWHMGNNIDALICRIRNTDEMPVVYALKSAIEAGLLVVTANGNTRSENALPPFDYLSVGGFKDQGKADRSLYRVDPDEPWGLNGDGHLRPDVLAPNLSFPVPFSESPDPPKSVSFFGGTSGGSSAVAGLCAYLFSLYPEIDSCTLKQALIQSACPIPGSENHAGCINGAAAIRLIEQGNIDQPSAPPPVIRISNLEESLASNCGIERAIALTKLVEAGACERSDLWKFTEDTYPSVRKVAIFSLEKPQNNAERNRLWDRLSNESDSGVRGIWAYLLLGDTCADEIDRWMSFVHDSNSTVQCAINHCLEQHVDAPKLSRSNDPNQNKASADKVVEWYCSERQ